MATILSFLQEWLKSKEFKSDILNGFRVSAKLRMVFRENAENPNNSTRAGEGTNNKKKGNHMVIVAMFKERR